VSFARKVGTISRDAEAEAIWTSVYHNLSEEKDSLVGALLGRAEAQVMRLTCAYALMNMCEIVGSSRLEAALAFWAYAEQSAQYILARLEGTLWSIRHLKV
jgi:hypothetical protein